MRLNRVGLVGLAAVLLLAACAGPTQSISSPPPPSTHPAVAEIKVPDEAGTWVGTTTTNGGAIRNVAFKIGQNETQLFGTYKCWCGPGCNSACRNLDTSGAIAGGAITGSDLNMSLTMYPDYSYCTYAGKLSAGKLSGTYWCRLQGRMVEMGFFRLEHQG